MRRPVNLRSWQDTVRGALCRLRYGHVYQVIYRSERTVMLRCLICGCGYQWRVTKLRGVGR